MRGAVVGRDPKVEREFRAFVADRSVSLQRTAYLLTGDWASAEDLVQTTLMKTYLAWTRAGGIEAVEPYARKVMVNTATSWWRRKWRGEWPTADMVERSLPDGADEWLERETVWQLIKTLPAGQRAVLVLRFYEDLTEAETARLLGVSVGTVKRQASRAFDSLRKRLGVPGTDAAMVMRGRKK
jgi:RNA polymerase sigma-70 factor (ECF subfamily)